MTATEQIALLGVLFTIINGLMTLYITSKKDDTERANQFRDDLLSRVTQQDSEIKELKIENTLVRQKLQEIIENTAREIDKWKESYYMALKQIDILNRKADTLQLELEQVNKSYEILHAEYTRTQNLLPKFPNKPLDNG